MYHVIDTIEFSETWLRHHPDLAHRFGEGLQVILDPGDTANGVNESATFAEIADAAGVAQRLPVAKIEKNLAGVYAVFFHGAPRPAISRGAKLTLE